MKIDLYRAQGYYLAACKILKAKRVDRSWFLEFLCDERYKRLELADELRRFVDYWSDQPRRPKSIKLALRNWMRIALKDLPHDEPAKQSVSIDGQVLEISTVGGYPRCPAPGCTFSGFIMQDIYEHVEARHRGR